MVTEIAINGVKAYSVGDAAGVIGISLPTLWLWLRKEKVKETIWFNGSRYIPATECERLKAEVNRK